MKKQTKANFELIIKNLMEIQAEEVRNNFKNNNLWNECESMISCIKMHGQTNWPEKIYDEAGYEVGYKLNTGEVIEYGCMADSLNCR